MTTPSNENSQEDVKQLEAGLSSDDKSHRNSSPGEGDDPIIVDWDGPNDPENPKKCAGHINLTSPCVLKVLQLVFEKKMGFSNSGVVLYFHYTSSVVNGGTCSDSNWEGVWRYQSRYTINDNFYIRACIWYVKLEYQHFNRFITFLGFGPLILAPWSEVFGRAPVLQIANLFFLVFNLACGFARSTGQLLAFRFLAGFGGSAPLAVNAYQSQ